MPGPDHVLQLQLDFENAIIRYLGQGPKTKDDVRRLCYESCTYPKHGIDRERIPEIFDQAFSNVEKSKKVTKQEDFYHAVH